MKDNRLVEFCSHCPYSINDGAFSPPEALSALPVVNGEHVICRHGGRIVTLEALAKRRTPKWICPSTRMTVEDTVSIFGK